MDPMQKEVQQNRNGMVGKEIINVEQEAMEHIFQNRPDEVSKEDARSGFCECLGGDAREDGCRVWIERCVDKVREGMRETDERANEEVRGNWEPDERYDEPFCAREDLGHAVICKRDENPLSQILTSR